MDYVPVLVYVTVKLIVKPGQSDVVLHNYEFEGDTLLDAWNSAADWLTTNRREEYAYVVWA